jgi:hypothetical protein
VTSIRGAIDTIATTGELEHIKSLLPAEWLEAAALGSAADCAAKVSRQFDLGVDGVIMHGATPAELAPVIDAYRGIRTGDRHADLPRNPGAPRPGLGVGAVHDGPHADALGISTNDQHAIAS